jgi:hypothetical protein
LASRVPRVAPAIVDEALRAPGRELGEDIRAPFESRLGHDFGRVRVHADPTAEQAAASVGARAFTVGEDIVFARGAFDPGSTAGRRLLAHELTHVAQSYAGRSASRPQARLEVGDAADPLEREADGAAERIVNAPTTAFHKRSAPPSPGRSAAVLHRMPAAGELDDQASEGRSPGAPTELEPSTDDDTGVEALGKGSKKKVRPCSNETLPYTGSFTISDNVWIPAPSESNWVCLNKMTLSVDISSVSGGCKDTSYVLTLYKEGSGGRAILMGCSTSRSGNASYQFTNIGRGNYAVVLGVTGYKPSQCFSATATLSAAWASGTGSTLKTC